jgi:2-amino-1-hydroxyethylphosphonate dioxygenase (glycine-forming)
MTLGSFELYSIMTKAEEITQEIFSLYEKYGNADYIGEPVSQLEHMSQSAQLAIEGGYDDEVILAAFFHDIGHICVQVTAGQSMDGYGVKRHEQIGADFLRERGFPERLAKLVENHVQAKRYLTYKFPPYYENLSEASKKTLEFQGGVMNKEEALAFEQDPLFELSILMRKWDEEAKEEFKMIMDLEILKNKCANLLQKN